MNKQEYLLTCLSEECAELQQAIAKTLRFGLDKGNPLSEIFVPNREQVKKEFNHVISIVQMLNENDILDMNISDYVIEYKKQKVKEYMKVSREVGTLK